MVREIVSKLRRKYFCKFDVAKKNKSLTGMKERCIMNNIQKFHIYENISVDKMHDWCQGGGKKCPMFKALRTSRSHYLEHVQA